MITERSLIIANGEVLFKIKFQINNGLQ